MKALIVDDMAEKASDLRSVISAAGIDDAMIDTVPDVIQARRALAASRYDLLLLDVILPRRFGDEPTASAGLDLLKALSQDGSLRKPNYVIGVTAVDSAWNDTMPLFKENLWILLRYDRSSEDWAACLRRNIKYISDASIQKTTANTSSDYGCDVGIITALQEPEFAAVKNLPINWSVSRFPNDSADYMTGQLDVTNGRLSLAAYACVQMGLTASAAAAGRLIRRFSPRYIVMLGICAGYPDMCKLGDIVICDQTWESGSGKIVAIDGKRRLLPEPRTIQLRGSLRERLAGYGGETDLTRRIYSDWRGGRPPNVPKIVFGPMVSGAAVIANEEEAASFRAINRKIAAIDMEAYAIYYSAEFSDRPCPIPVVIKSVCDFANDKKDSAYQDYAAYSSARVFHEMALNGVFSSTWG